MEFEGWWNYIRYNKKLHLLFLTSLFLQLSRFRVSRSLQWYFYFVTFFLCLLLISYYLCGYELNNSFHRDMCYVDCKLVVLTLPKSVRYDGARFWWKVPFKKKLKPKVLRKWLDISIYIMLIIIFMLHN